MASKYPLEPDPEAYTKAVTSADSLRAIIARFDEKRAFVRATEPLNPNIRKELDAEAGRVVTNRDRAVLALANKACNTHAAVRLLADAGNGDDAIALSRVLLENAVI